MPAGPKFIRFFWPIVAALRELGGAARPREVVDLAIEKLGLPDEERAEQTKSGRSELTIRRIGLATTSCGEGCSMARSVAGGS